jgi:hypothetical protein
LIGSRSSSKYIGRPVWSRKVISIRFLVFLPDGKSLLSGSEGGELVWWDVPSEARLRRWQLPGRINGLACAADGRHVAIGNSNGTIYGFRLSPMPSSTYAAPRQ